jgi:CBS domain-containing protein
MVSQSKVPDGNESYFDDEPRKSPHVFDAELLTSPLDVLPKRRPVVFPQTATVTEAMRAMQNEHRGCVVITEDGTPDSRLIGIFTERDILYRVVDRGRNPATLPLSEVMTVDPDGVPRGATLAWVLNEMAVGGFRHVPVVDAAGRPVFVISVRDVVHLLVEFFPTEILTLPPRYRESGVKTREGA